MKKYITLLFVALMVATASAQQSHTEDGITITADKLHYFCEPVSSPDGCLIDATLTIENSNIAPAVGFLSVDADTAIRYREFSSRGKSIAFDKSKGKNARSEDTHIISASSTETFRFQFYAQESGKFNFSIKLGANIITLDPFFNVTYNTTAPSLHLVRGVVKSGTDASFITKTNITTELSDSSDATKFEVRSSGVQALQGTATLLLGAHFDETSGTSAQDYSDFNRVGFYNNSPKLTQIGIKNTAVKTNGSSFAEFRMPSTTLPESSLAVCFGYNSSGATFSGDAIIGGLGSEGFRVTGQSADRIRWTTQRSGSGTKNLDVTFTFDTNSLHTVCLFQNSTHLTSYVNNVLRDNNAQTQVGTMALPSSIYAGRLLSGVTDGDDLIDELCVVQGTFKASQVASIYQSSKSCESFQSLKSEGKALRNSFPIAFNTNNDYWISVRKTNAGIQNLSVHLYNPAVQPLLVNGNIMSGESALKLPITQNITASLRYYTSTPSNISEALLIEGINDSTPPAVQDAQVNDTQITCNDTVRLSANVTDNTFLSSVSFTYTDVFGTFTVPVDRIPSTDIFTLDLSYSHDTAGANQSVVFDSVNATDIVQQSTITNPSLLVLYSCGQVPPDEPDAIISLTSPANTSVDSDGLVTFTYSTNVTGNGTLFYESSLAPSVTVNGGSVQGTGSLSFPPIQFTQNQTLLWFVNHTFNPTIMSEVFELNITITEASPADIQDAFQLFTCPVETLEKTLLFMFFFLISIMVVIIGKVFSNGLTGFLGAFMLLILSFYLWACIAAVAFLMGFISIALMFMFVIKGGRGTL